MLGRCRWLEFAAWAAARFCVQQAEQDKSRVAFADSGSMLRDSELSDVETPLWQKYKLRFPARTHPSDELSQESRATWQRARYSRSTHGW